MKTTKSVSTRRAVISAAVLGTRSMTPGVVSAAIIETFITGDTASGDNVIFRAVLDPAVAGSATVSIAVTET